MIVAYVDSLGYLRCADCAESCDRADIRVKDHAVYHDSAPHNAEDCDFCNFPVLISGQED